MDSEADEREEEVREALGESRLPWWDLSRVEIAAMRATGLDLDARPCRIIAVRNMLTWLWRQRRANGHISRAEGLRALGGTGLQRVWYSEAVHDVHWLLERVGVINFGATRRLTLRIPRPPRSDARKAIVVIGAGLAGLAAAEQLRRFGHRVVVLEAQKLDLAGRIVGEGPTDVKAKLAAARARARGQQLSAIDVAKLAQTAFVPTGGARLQEAAQGLRTSPATLCTRLAAWRASARDRSPCGDVEDKEAIEAFVDGVFTVATLDNTTYSSLPARSPRALNVPWASPPGLRLARGERAGSDE